MQLLLFKTDITSQRKIKTVKPLFKNLPAVMDWNVDTEDIDNVLRIEASEKVTESDIIQLIQTHGFTCEVLED